MARRKTKQTRAKKKPKVSGYVEWVDPLTGRKRKANFEVETRSKKAAYNQIKSEYPKGKVIIVEITRG